MGICIIGSVATRIVRFGHLGIIFRSVVVVYPNSGGLGTIDLRLYDYRIFGIYYYQEISSKTKPRTFSAMFFPRINDCLGLAIIYSNTQLIMLVHACGYYSREATN